MKICSQCHKEAPTITLWPGSKAELEICKDCVSKIKIRDIDPPLTKLEGEVFKAIQEFYGK